MDSLSIDFAISHNRDDSALAQALLNRLEEAGLLGWIDSCAFYSPLTRAEQQIELAFRLARFHCLLVGCRYRDSAWCREEYSFGLRFEEDLSITRVLVIVENSTADALVPDSLANAPRFNCAIEAEMQRLAILIKKDGCPPSTLAKWAMGDKDRTRLVSRLSKAERIKLTGDHLEFLLQHFRPGTVPPRNHLPGLRLGITVGPSNRYPTHLSPAAAIEMFWRWVSGIVGEHKLKRFLEEEPATEEEILELYVSEIGAVFEKALPELSDYLAIAASRRDEGPKVIEAEVLAVDDYIVCGFLAVCYRANQCGADLIRNVRGLLQYIAANSDKPVSDVANYLDAGLPTVSLPGSNHVRRLRILDLLRG